MDDEKHETAWLIEHPRLPLWWGTDCGGDWVGAARALRLARKQDAEAMARFLKLDGAHATEHMWCLLTIKSIR